MDWLTKCTDFYRTANNYDEYDRAGLPGEKAYRDVVSDLSSYSSISIQICIAAHQKQPYFNINDFLTDHFFDVHKTALDPWNQLRTNIGHWGSEGILLKNIKAMVNFMAQKYLQKYGIKTDRDRYKFETLYDYYNPQTLELARRSIILGLIRLRKEDMERAADMWKGVWYDREGHRLFDKPFLKRLAETFGPDFYDKTYVNVWGIDNEENPEEGVEKLLKKRSITMYDVIIINTILVTYPRSMFLKMIQKADPAAKNWMRRYLYNDASRYVTQSFFMLSEDMSPMNENYERIDLPNYIGCYTMGQIKDKDVVEKWTKIFHEFEIIPLP